MPWLWKPWSWYCGVIRIHYRKGRRSGRSAARWNCRYPAGQNRRKTGMTLHGSRTIELTDVETGAVETVTEENMITEAVNHILGLNPMGIFYAATGQYDNAVLWNGNLLPICPNMIGGILLFSEALTEDEELLYESSDNLPVRSEEHTSELQSRFDLVCRLLLEN